jgi:hypothetical protein
MENPLQKFLHIMEDEGVREMLDALVEGGDCYQTVYFTEDGNWSHDRSDFPENVDVFSLHLRCGLTDEQIQYSVDASIW